MSLEDVGFGFGFISGFSCCLAGLGVFFSPKQRIYSAAAKLERSHSAVNRNKENYTAFALEQDSHLS